MEKINGTFLILLFFSISSIFGQSFNQIERELWKKHALNSMIIRDSWGVPHIEGKTDADAVFALMYAQCEDDFERIEKNYIEKLGRIAEIEGESVLYTDLFTRIILNQDEAKAEYNTAEPWLKDLLNAHAAGINFYLKKHPNVKPKLLTRFEPWFALLWTDGSIGAVNTAEITKDDVKAFFLNSAKTAFLDSQQDDYQQSGSNGFAIAPQKSETGNALLYINPHTTFFYRPEVHFKSKQGLNTYGAVTWGQFFVYQGFNENCGWMHTSSNADVADVYIETLKTQNGKSYFKKGQTWFPVKNRKIILKYLLNNKLESKVFSVNYTQNGPILAQKEGKFLSLHSNNRSKNGLVQSWLRTKARNFVEFQNTMNIRANTSNNTVYADKDGSIAYWHGNYMPRRDPGLNWSKPQDGSVLTKFKGLHEMKEMISLKNPKSNWIQNCNSTPFTAAAEYSPKKENYPPYMAPDGENFRGIRDSNLLNTKDKLSLDKLIGLGYDNYLTAFEVLINGMKARNINSSERETQEVLDSLFAWDFRSTTTSVATTLAVEWGQKLNPAIRKIYVDQGEADQVQQTRKFIETSTIEEILGPLKDAYLSLKNTFGTWKKPWGEYNRFQRISANDDEHLDNMPSIAVPYASALWGSLPSFNSKKYIDSKLRYGYSGNSFVCAVEFGKRVRAKSLLAGGNPSDANNPNFNSQAKNYANGIFKEVWFYPEDIKMHISSQYRPGENPK